MNKKREKPSIIKSMMLGIIIFIVVLLVISMGVFITTRSKDVITSAQTESGVENVIIDTNEPNDTENSIENLKKKLEERFDKDLDEVNRVIKSNTKLEPINKKMGSIAVLYNRANNNSIVQIAYTMITDNQIYYLMSYGNEYKADGIIIASVTGNQGNTIIYNDPNYGQMAMKSYYDTLNYATNNENVADAGILNYLINQDGAKWEEMK